MDVDGSGSLDTGELASALRARFGVTASIAELTRMLSAADTDGNGTLEFDEFEDVVRDVLAKAADRAVRAGQPPRQAELQRGAMDLPAAQARYSGRRYSTDRSR